MGRHREFEPDEALDRAVEVFWAKGYEATSVEDLLIAMGINRASLYATFGDKAQLFAAVLERYERAVASQVAAALAPPIAGVAAVEAFFRAMVAAATPTLGPRGCLVLQTAAACTTAPPELLERVLRTMQRTQLFLLAALRRDPAFAGRKDLRVLARFLAAQGHGLVLLARAGTKRHDLEDAARVALRSLVLVDEAPRRAREHR
jgi:TetR/AcrR family transcriptional regulator, transcriptional repressor for nem operon